MSKPVLLIPEVLIGDADAEHQRAIRDSIRRADRARENARKEYAETAPDYVWKVARRR